MFIIAALRGFLTPFPRSPTRGILSLARSAFPTKARAGMAKIPQLEQLVHGRERDLDDEDELRFGVVDEMLYARNVPGIEGAQWTGIVTQIAISMLESGAVDAVVCVQSDENDRCSSARQHPPRHPACTEGTCIQQLRERMRCHLSMRRNHNECV